MGAGFPVETNQLYINRGLGTYLPDAYFVRQKHGNHPSWQIQSKNCQMKLRTKIEQLVIQQRLEPSEL